MVSRSRRVQTVLAASALLPLCLSQLVPVLAASSHLKPVLKAIDPSTAKVEEKPIPPVQPAQSQPAQTQPPPAYGRGQGVPGFMPQANRNPHGGAAAPQASSAPYPPGAAAQSAPAQTAQPAYGRPAPGYAPPGSAYGQVPPGYGQAGTGYGQPQAGYPPQNMGYPAQPYGQAAPAQNPYANPYGQPQGFQGYGQPAYQPAPSQYQPSSPPQYAQPPQYQPAQPQYQQPAQVQYQPPSQPSYPPPMQPPAQQPAYQGQSPGFASGMYGGPAPASVPQPANGAQDASPDEIRVGRLEQSAFGASYPEHEVDDRLEHLEREAFGDTSPSTPVPDRIARLEAKFGGGSAFGRSQSPPPAAVQPPPVTARPPVQMQQPPPPVVATTYPPVSQPQARYQPQTQAPPSQPPSRIRFLTPPQGQAAPREAPPPPSSVPGQPLPPAGEQALAPRSAPAAGGADQIVANIPQEPLAGDFFAQIQKFNGTCARWTRFPIRVHLPLNSPDAWQGQLDDAVKSWSAYIPLIVAPAGESADIEVAWINHLPPRQLGITNLEIFNGHPRVTIYLLRPAYYLPGVPEGTVHYIAVHELGHALGLWGHSSVAGDIMQPQERSLPGKPSVRTKYSGISARDLNTLRRIYQSAPLPDGFQSGQPISYP